MASKKRSIVKLSKWNDSGVNCELNVVLSGDEREISGQYFYTENRTEPIG